jgi:hypothetical protein
MEISAGGKNLMPDTKANQGEFSQNKSQAEGLGFPIARIVGVFFLATEVLGNYGENCFCHSHSHSHSHRGWSP